MRRSLFAFALLCVTACDGDAERASSSAGGSGGAGASASTSSTGFGGGTPIEIWCGAVGPALCEALFACCTDPRVLGSYGGTVEACKSEFATDCAGNVARDVGPLLDAGTSVLDEGHLAECVAELEALAAGGAACTQPPRWTYITTCVAAFEGQVAPGDACVTTPDDISFVECSQGLCHGGTCDPLKKAGEPCALQNDLCDYTAGLWCVFDGTTASCAARGDIGDPCTPLDGEDVEIECKSLVCGADGKCAPADGELLCASAS